MRLDIGAGYLIGYLKVKHIGQLQRLNLKEIGNG